MLHPCCVLMEGMLPSTMYDWRLVCLYKALRAQGKEKGPLSLDDLAACGHLDQYHYDGTRAVEQMVGALKIDTTKPLKDVHILDVGSGLGGCSRHIASKFGCRVTGVEIQSSLVSAARDITKRCGLQHCVSTIEGDVCEVKVVVDIIGSCDHAVSSLVILHIKDRNAVFQNIYRALKPGGTMCLEDYVSREGMTESERAQALRDVGCAWLPCEKQYKDDLLRAGFVNIHIDDLTDQWKRFTRERAESYSRAIGEEAKAYGKDVANTRLGFYRSVQQLFDGGNLAGVRISATKPKTSDVTNTATTCSTNTGTTTASSTNTGTTTASSTNTGTTTASSTNTGTTTASSTNTGTTTASSTNFDLL
eukprot:GHVS01051508.1.p1 GENE.GHVS01051508.1~~GHVS01051508.1.p1  ORF type:complete len:421 (+),score=67.24 GHVS01051508.1:180-1265(+)